MLLLFLSGCQPQVYLMPAPVGITHDTQLFMLGEESTDENLLHTLYATNRIPFNKDNNSTGYSILPSSSLEPGFLVYCVILTFSWPSAENLFKYKTDVLHAGKTIPAFGQLVEILALYTEAHNINIVAYSAGAQGVAPGLAYLHDLYPRFSSRELKEKLRIGEVYFAAPDTAFKPFTERYLKFRDIVNRTPISLNMNDRILFLAAVQNGMSSLGRPDTNELDDSERQIMLESLDRPDLDVIDAGGSRALNLGKSHDYWYSNPWIRNDLVMLLIFNANPEERGLIPFLTEAGATLYHFPEDYAERMPFLLKQQKERAGEKPVYQKEGKG